MWFVTANTRFTLFHYGPVIEIVNKIRQQLSCITWSIVKESISKLRWHTRKHTQGCNSKVKYFCLNCYLICTFVENVINVNGSRMRMLLFQGLPKRTINIQCLPQLYKQQAIKQWYHYIFVWNVPNFVIHTFAFSFIVTNALKSGAVYLPQELLLLTFQKMED